MNATDRTTLTWITAAAAAAVTGGLCWVAKQGVIAATVPSTGGPPPESLAIAVFYLLGAALMAVSGSGLVALMTVGRPMLLRVAVALVVSPLIFWGTFTLVDMVVDAVAGPDAGWWWPGEGAILITGLLFASAGAVALVRRRTSAVPVSSSN
jgi:ACR3 family arsenite efflux pump ArsB